MVYAAADVQSVRRLWSRSGALAGIDVRTQLEAYADALIAAHVADEPGAAVRVKNWWRVGADGPLPSRMGVREAGLMAARDHGFDTWPSVAGRCDAQFELALDTVVE
jgi:hypothetical protein